MWEPVENSALPERRQAVRDLDEKRQLPITLLSHRPVGFNEFHECHIPGLSSGRWQSTEAIENLPTSCGFRFAERVFEKALDAAAGELPIDNSSNGDFAGRADGADEPVDRHQFSLLRPPKPSDFGGSLASIRNVSFALPTKAGQRSNATLQPRAFSIQTPVGCKRLLGSNAVRVST